MFVFLYYAPWPPQPLRWIPHTPRCRNSKRGAEQGWQRMSEHIRGWGKASSISYFPKRPLSNGSTTFLTNPPRLLGLHVAPWILVSLNVSPLSQHVIQLPEIHAWLFHADMHRREMRRRQGPGKSQEEGERYAGPVLTLIHLFSFWGGKKCVWHTKTDDSFICKGWSNWGGTLFQHCRFWQRYRQKYSVGKKQTPQYKYISLLSKLPSVWPRRVNQCFILKRTVMKSHQCF